MVDEEVVAGERPVVLVGERVRHANVHHRDLCARLVFAGRPTIADQTHDRVELDQAALRAQQHDSREALQRRVAKADQEAVREAEAKLTGSTPQMPAAAADPETEKLDALMKLDELHTSGAITDTEFEAAVTKLGTVS